ncbi:hypothetical protein LTR56_014876 [Elasticomyces elasticus]|nr:hypothetical protein LTR22_021179 [Elasticomyces elasticus]KAK3635104.1 hypothetical protein LTR56_014876 [Elasticomyces elasticus]KAK4909318.1 hypothetical protein LTR49_021909 [Elasticomyces elasticus]KAK5749889.1 hypothetical protein LTS12_020035 [Elasticomyces elasticus]
MVHLYPWKASRGQNQSASEANTVGGAITKTKNRELSSKLNHILQRTKKILKPTSRTTSNPSPPPCNQQTASPLFRLPRELRDQIWSNVLHASTHPTTAHFHIYGDTIIDSCTYDGEKAMYHRSYALRTALLRTCRAVYEDAVQVLYDETHFDLVVLAGLPRPYKVQDYAGRSRKLSDRHVLGRLQECEVLLRRIRHATLIVQPGRKPDAQKYEQGLLAFVQALAGGAQLRTLRIYLNIGRSVTGAVTPDGLRTLKAATKILATQIVRKPSRERRTTVRRCESLAETDRDIGIARAILSHVLEAEDRDDPLPFVTKDDICLARGLSSPDPSLHQLSSLGVWERRAKEIGMGAFMVVTSPIWVPWLLVTEPKDGAMSALGVATAPVVVAILLCEKIRRRRVKGQRLITRS